MFDICDFEGLKLLTRLRLGLSHLRLHKFNYNFQDTVLPLCLCNAESESTIHFFLRCQYFTQIRISFLNDINFLCPIFFSLNDQQKCKILLYGNIKYSDVTNKIFLLCSIKFIKESQRFNDNLFWKGGCSIGYFDIYLFFIFFLFLIIFPS